MILMTSLVGTSERLGTKLIDDRPAGRPQDLGWKWTLAPLSLNLDLYQENNHTRSTRPILHTSEQMGTSARWRAEPRRGPVETSRDQLDDLIRAIDCVNLIRKLDRRVIYYNMYISLFITYMISLAIVFSYIYLNWVYNIPP